MSFSCIFLRSEVQQDAEIVIMIKIIRLPFTDNTQYILVANFQVNNLMECCQNSSRITGSMFKQNSTFTLDLLQESQ